VQGCARSPLLESHERFDLISRIGEGAHGEVFEAFDRVRQTRVALKALRHSSPQSILRFKREFRALVSIHHPNLVEFGELFEHSGRWFFSMELIDGVDFVRYVRHDSQHADPLGDRTLSELSGSTRACDPERLSHALVQLGHGLQALHSAGKIHRDIKPSNILVRPDGRLVVLDFGLVTPSLQQSTSGVGQVVGTLGYMAPEQAGARVLSPAADCYAVGVLIYEALTGELPFDGPPLEVLQAKQSQTVEIPRAQAESLPSALVELCHALCRFDPAQRPSVAELIARAESLQMPARLRTPERSHDSGAAQDRAATTAPCFGRERELALLDGAFERARDGALSKVRIHGASGLGKTALLRAFRERLAERSHAFVLSGSCHEQERVAYKAFDAAIDDLGRRLERLTHEQCARLAPKHAAALASVFPVLGRLAESVGANSALPPDPITLRSHAYAALRDLLHRMAERAPVVLILDDLQWSDAESLELLWALIRPPDPPPLLLLAAMWPMDECRADLRESIARAFAHHDSTSTLEVCALPVAAAAELAQHLLQAAPDSSAAAVSGVSAERLAAAAGCHPHFIEVLARATQRQQREVYELDEALRLEMAALSETAHPLLQLLAVAGTSIAERSLADAAGLPPDDFAHALAELRHGRFARVNETAGEFSVAPYHAKMRSALIAQLDEATLRRHHLALAQALTRGSGRDPEALAVHWLRAGRSEEAAVCFAQAAAIAERSQAFVHAAELYRSALETAADSSPRERRRWLQQLGQALAHAGRSAEAGEAFLAAADGCERPRARDLLRLAAEQFLRAGKTDSGLQIARPLLAEIGESLPKSASLALARLGWQRARANMRGTEVRERAPGDMPDSERYACDLLWSLSFPLTSLDLVRGIDLHTRCLLRALRLGDPARIARSLALECLYMRNDTADRELRVRGVLATAETLARHSKDPYLQGFSQLCHSTFHLLMGEPTLSLATADSAAFLFEDECRNVAWEIGLARVAALAALTYLGRFRDVARRFEAAAEEAAARGNTHGFTTLVTFNRCSLDLVADRADACRADIERVMRDCAAEWHLQHAFALGANVLLDLYAGGDAAHLRIEAGWQTLRHRLILSSDRFRIFFLFVRGLAALSALIADDRDRRARVRLVQACATRLARERHLDALGGAHMLQGQLAAHHGDRATAVAQYRMAAELWGRVGMYGGKIASLRLGEIIGGDEGAALIADCMQWAGEENIRRPEQFFRICGPVGAPR